MNDDLNLGGPLLDGPAWSPKLAAELVGKRVLVGVMDLAADGTVLGRREFHGHAIRADWRAGIALRLAGDHAGAEVVLPPDTSAFHPATPGEYRLGGTGDVGPCPDYVATWYVRDGGAGRGG